MHSEHRDNYAGGADYAKYDQQLIPLVDRAEWLFVYVDGIYGINQLD